MHYYYHHPLFRVYNPVNDELTMAIYLKKENIGTNTGSVLSTDEKMAQVMKISPDNYQEKWENVITTNKEVSEELLVEKYWAWLDRYFLAPTAAVVILIMKSFLKKVFLWVYNKCRGYLPFVLKEQNGTEPVILSDREKK